MTDDQMSPDASPDELSRKSGVRRVNNLPVYLVGAALAGFLAIMVAVAADRTAKPSEHAEAAQGKPGDTRMFAAAIAGDRKDGIIPAEGIAAHTGDGPPIPGDRDLAVLSVPIARPDNANSSQAPPMPPPIPAATQRTGGDEEAARIRMMKLQQFEEAIKAKTGVQLAQMRSPGSPDPGIRENSAPAATRDETLARLAALREQSSTAAAGDASAAYKARLEQLRSAGLVSAGPSQLLPTAAAPVPPSDIAQFAASGPGQGDRWRLDSQPEPPRTPYELRAGAVIPATLISGINSGLPGQIVGQCSHDVYDTATGKYKLIPQGCRFVGAYSNEVAYGQSRILVAWQRIIFPDGKAMDIGAMPGADGAGNAGFTDQTNNHYLRLFSSAFLMSAVVGGITLSQGNQNVNALTAPTASTAMSAALGQQLGQVTAQLIAKNLNIAPTLEIRPGYRFNVIVTKDMTFSKP
ncbi:MAG: TrbI/VirB10 family protein, partial [Betaproteobacteria bacterium]